MMSGQVVTGQCRMLESNSHPFVRLISLHCSWASTHCFSFSHLKGEIWTATFTRLNHIDEGL